MAMFISARSILAGEPIKLFNHGKMRRDFTYIDDVVEAVVRLVSRPPRGEPASDGSKPDPACSKAPWKVYNVGNNHPHELTYVVALLEKEFGKAARKEIMPMQPGDVEATYADVAALEHEINFRPSTRIEDGVARFAKWYVPPVS